jgi:hypothetical protein
MAQVRFLEIEILSVARQVCFYFKKNNAKKITPTHKGILKWNDVVSSPTKEPADTR